MSRPVFLLFGDSITQEAHANNGWASLLAHEYVTRVDIINRGFSGYNSRWAKMIAPEVFAKPLTTNSLSLVTIFFGANDAVRQEYGEKQYVPVAEYEKNIEDIIRTATGFINFDGSLTQVILITPPPVNQEAWRKRCEEKYADDKTVVVPPESNRGNDVLAPYVEALKRVSEKTGYPLLNLFEGMQKGDTAVAAAGGTAADEQDAKKRKIDTAAADNGEPLYYSYLSDGLHLSESGNRFVFDALSKVIQDKYEKRLGIEVFKRQFRHHSEIDPKNPRGTLMAGVVGSWISN